MEQVDWERAKRDSTYFWEVASPAVLTRDARAHPERYADLEGTPDHPLYQPSQGRDEAGTKNQDV